MRFRIGILIACMRAKVVFALISVKSSFVQMCTDMRKLEQVRSESGHHTVTHLFPASIFHFPRASGGQAQGDSEDMNRPLKSVSLPLISPRLKLNFSLAKEFEVQSDIDLHLCVRQVSGIL